MTTKKGIASTEFLFFWLFALVLYSVLYYFKFQFYLWPEMDNYPFFLRFYNDEFLKGNFIVESVQVGPRNIYQYFIIGISSLLGGRWQIAIIITNFLCLVNYPLVYNAVLKFSDDNFQKRNKNLAVIFTLLWIIFSFTPYYLQSGVVGWRMFVSGFAAYKVSLLLVLLGYLSTRPYVKYPLLFFSSLMHPTTGGFFILMLVVFSLVQKRSDWIPLLAAFLGSYLVLFFGFQQESVLTAKEFVDIYVHSRHAHHYSMFVILSKSLEVTKLAAALAFFLVCWIWKKHNSYFILLTILVLACLAPILFVDLYPTKIFASLGTNRVFYFLPFMVLVCLSTLLKKDIQLPRLIPKKISYILIGVATVVYFILFLPYAFEDKQYSEALAKTIKENPGELIIVDRANEPKYESYRVLCKYEANVYISNIFPFNEKYFKEFDYRYRFHRNVDYSYPQIEEFKERGITCILTQRKLDHPQLKALGSQQDVYLYKIL